ncbi:histidine--tRNA ligase [Patescibacteria group bacterium]|nr:histidine--tRNA ligase [Patescibacteria group bacterium]MBU3999733.1 histidine--tRNA ligase [Patescibacteria group bacterium]MBU4057110.1 histidine--tRNA ligase [Patescibacteria group bacterium]MBU4369022.1 histidine--tRNA ligase [Patescibacteria group bacterium]
MSAKIKQELINPPRGTTDLLPNDFLYWDYFLSVINKYAGIYGFGKIETPIMEDTDLFVRSIGETTDIVEKEMFSFATRGGDKLTLRPEGTASVARAYITNGMSKWSQPVKLFYVWPMFRYERPQAGRRRQFNQAGFEILGGGDPIFDAQIIQLCWTVFEKLKLKNIAIQINSIGDAKCRSKYRSALVDYYRPRASKLCANCRVRLAKNPLRLMDCKEEKCVLIRSSAPQTIDYLCQECHDHFKSVLEYLDEINLPYMLNPYLVRGLDYYTKTVFEFISEGDEYRQSSLGGGGRYDTLIEMLGGEPTPAVGVALGIERIVEKIKEANISLGKKVSAKVFLVQLCDLAKKKSFKLFNDLIEAGVPAMESFGRGSIKSQLRVANRLKIKNVLIIGQKEALDNTVIIRDMESGTQEVADRAKIINIIRKKK